MSRNKIGGWTRIWIVISELWIGFCLLGLVTGGLSGATTGEAVSAVFLFGLCPPLVLYVFGWGANWAVRWIVRGFRCQGHRPRHQRERTALSSATEHQ